MAVKNRGDDARDNQLILIIEIKGSVKKMPKRKKMMENYRVVGLNNLVSFSRWTFTEIRDVFEIKAAFDKLVEEALSENCESTRMHTNGLFALIRVHSR